MNPRDTVNKRLRFAIPVGVVLALAVGLAVTDRAASAYAFQLLETSQLIVMMEMLINGTFISTRYFKIILALLGSLIIGAVISIIHSQSSDVIMLASLTGILITYLIHFLGKERKTALDFMKLLTVFCLFPLPLLFFRPISGETTHIVQLLGYAVAGMTFVLYLLKGERRNGYLFFSKEDKTSQSQDAK